MEFILYQIIKTNSWKCKEVLRDKNASVLMEHTINKGYNFFINSTTGGTRYIKKICSEKWKTINRARPVKNFTE